MADAKASEFTPTSSVTGADVVPVIQGGANKIVALSAVKTSYLDTLYQPLDADLTAIAGVTSAANKIPYFTGAGAAAVADFTAAGRALVDDASAAAQCTTLGLGTGDSPTFAAAVLKAAAPDLKLIDSDTADADAGVRLLAAATTTTAAHEYVDATFYQQVDGSPVAFLTADADGSIILGDGTRPIVLSGTVGDVTISDATPVLQFKDSSCTDADVNFDITANATDTGTTTEDIDVAFAAQVAGNKVTFINFDADGSLSLGYGGQSVWIAKLNAAKTVIPNTGTATPASTDSGTVYTNEGDGDGSTVTLPAAAAGLQFTIVVQAAQTLTVTANTADTIRIAGSVTAAAGSISSNVVGSAITLVAINATEWVAISSVGSWTI